MLSSEESKLVKEKEEHKVEEDKAVIEAKKNAMKQAAADLKFANEQKAVAEKKAADELKAITDL